MNDYTRIAIVIRYLDQHQSEQPDLTSLAGIAGLSPFHFHRLFTRWAAITPKDFLQCLTANRVKEALRNGARVLDTALDAGLSGPGRLHDLCVNLEAASPGEIQAGGLGWELRAGFGDSPFGKCLIAESPRGICHLSFVDETDEPAAWKNLENDWPNAVLVRNDSFARKTLNNVFNRSPDAPSPLKMFVRGTAFQIRVWRALLELPAGRLITYGTLAEKIGQASAARAVGTAVGSNPIAYLIPCHRVIRETGIVGNYRWGRERKRIMLAHELACKS
jgi:O-6-methylguanine DNA methyltransferase